jgi:hypothetical protein
VCSHRALCNCSDLVPLFCPLTLHQHGSVGFPKNSDVSFVTSNFQVYFTTWLIDAEKVKKQRNVNSAYRKKLRQQHFTFRLTPRFKSHQSLFLSCHKTLLLTFTLIWTSACYLSSQNVHIYRIGASLIMPSYRRQGAPWRQCSMVFKSAAWYSKPDADTTNTELLINRDGSQENVCLVR